MVTLKQKIEKGSQCHPIIFSNNGKKEKELEMKLEDPEIFNQKGFALWLMRKSKFTIFANKQGAGGIYLMIMSMSMTIGGVKLKP